jgi:opacity protein-like surface antigen
MKKPILGMAMVLAAACTVCAQQSSSVPNPGRSAENAAAAFENTSAAQVSLMDTSVGESFNLSPVAAAAAAPASEPAPLPAAPAAKPKFVWGDRDDYRWQLGLGVEFLRFRSNVFNASIVGVNTTISYYTNTWFALEGNLVTAFGPPLVQDDHVKYFEGAGGIRIGGRRAQFEPWVHALVGGAHMQPQTAAGSRSALTATGGGGLDFRVNSRLSLRGEVDYIYSRFYSQTQNNFQAAAGVVFHF